MDAKLKYLEFIQGTIGRMSKSSFLLKGWSLTVVGGLLALTIKETEFTYAFVSLLAMGLFWLLDGYYLTQERLFIKLYDSARQIDESRIDFSMDTTPFKKDVLWPRCVFSRTLNMFYGGMFAMHVLIILIT